MTALLFRSAADSRLLLLVRNHRWRPCRAGDVPASLLIRQDTRQSPVARSYLVKGAKYLHDFDWLAHRRLAKALCRFTKTRVVISYYAHPDLAAMYPGWTVVDCAMTKSLVSQGRRDQKNDTASPEVLLVNGESYFQGEK